MIFIDSKIFLQRAFYILWIALSLLMKAPIALATFDESSLLITHRPLEDYRYLNLDPDSGHPGHYHNGPLIAYDLSHDLMLIAKVVRDFVHNNQTYRQHGIDFSSADNALAPNVLSLEFASSETRYRENLRQLSAYIKTSISDSFLEPLVAQTILDHFPYDARTLKRFVLPTQSMFQRVSIEQDQTVVQAMYSLEEVIRKFGLIAKSIDELVLSSENGGLQFSSSSHRPELPPALIGLLDQLVELSEISHQLATQISPYDPSQKVRELFKVEKDSQLEPIEIINRLEESLMFYLESIDFVYSLADVFTDRFSSRPGVVQLNPTDPNSRNNNQHAKAVLEEVITDYQEQLQEIYLGFRQRLETATAIRSHYRIEIENSGASKNSLTRRLHDTAASVVGRLEEAVSRLYMILFGREMYFETVLTQHNLGYDMFLSHGRQMYLSDRRPIAKDALENLTRLARLNQGVSTTHRFSCFEVLDGGKK